MVFVGIVVILLISFGPFQRFFFSKNFENQLHLTSTAGKVADYFVSWGLTKDESFLNPEFESLYWIGGTVADIYKSRGDYWLKVRTPKGDIELWLTKEGGKIPVVETVINSTESNVTFNIDNSAYGFMDANVFFEKYKDHQNKPVIVRLLLNDTNEAQQTQYDILEDECKQQGTTNLCDLVLPTLRDNYASTLEARDNFFAGRFIRSVRLITLIDGVYLQ